MKGSGLGPMTLGEGRLSHLPREVRENLRAYLKEVTGLFGSALKSVILYGSAVRDDFQPGRSNLNLFFLLKEQDLEALTRYAKIHPRWAKAGFVVPLLFTEPALQASLNLFPLEFLELLDHHVVLEGEDPFFDFSPDRRGLAVQCLQEIRGNLVRTRQRFVEGGGTTEVIDVLLPLSLRALLPCLRGLAYLLDRSVPGSQEDFLQEVGSFLSMETASLVDAWRLKVGMISPGSLEKPRLFERYLSSLEALSERAAKVLDVHSSSV